MEVGGRDIATYISQNSAPVLIMNRLITLQGMAECDNI